MRRVAFDTSGLSRWQRITVKWQVRRMGGRVIHTPYVPKGTAYIFDPEEQQKRLRQDLMKPWKLGITEDAHQFRPMQDGDGECTVCHMGIGHESHDVTESKE